MRKTKITEGGAAATGRPAVRSRTVPGADGPAEPTLTAGVLERLEAFKSRLAPAVVVLVQGFVTCTRCGKGFLVGTFLAFSEGYSLLGGPVKAGEIATRFCPECETIPGVGGAKP